MVTAQKSLHETLDLEIEDIIQSTLESLTVRLGVDVDAEQMEYFGRIGLESLRPNLKSKLARVGFDLDPESAKIVVDGTHIDCQVDLAHNMEHYRQGFDPLELVVECYEEGKLSGVPVKVAKIVGYPPDDVLKSDEIQEGIGQGTIRPLVEYSVDGYGILYLVLDNTTFEPNGSYGRDVMKDILRGVTSRIGVNNHNTNGFVREKYVRERQGLLTGTSIRLQGYEVLILDPEVDYVKHSEARFLGLTHQDYAHLEFHGDNPYKPVAEIRIMLIRPQFRAV